MITKMKKIIVLLLILCPMFVYSHGVVLNDHAKIKEFSSFRILGILDLRVEKDTTVLPKYRTLNHEGGMSVSVLEILKDDVYDGQHGKWLWVLLTAPMWVDSGDWIESYQKFLIFLPDDMTIYDFED